MLCSPTVIEARFWLKVLELGEDDCWRWLGATSNGYGKMYLGRDDGMTVSEYAHRYSWMLHNKRKIPRGMEVDHKCLTRDCTNPRHLELVSSRRNKELEGSRQTHCIAGHKYTELNTYVDPRGHRRCRRCAADRRLAA